MENFVCGTISLLGVVFVQGPVITALVQILKRVEWVKNNPLRAAALLNALAALANGVVLCGVAPGDILSKLAAGFLASVGTYESAKAVLNVLSSRQNQAASTANDNQPRQE